MPPPWRCAGGTFLANRCPTARLECQGRHAGVPAGMAEDESSQRADHALVQRVQQGDSTAFDLLVRKYQHRRSEEHTSELQSLMRISYAVFCLKKKKHHTH